MSVEHSPVMRLVERADADALHMFSFLLIRSHIDTTGVQSLIDTRTEVERWADQPVEVRYLFLSSSRPHAVTSLYLPSIYHLVLPESAMYKRAHTFLTVPFRDNSLTLDSSRPCGGRIWFRHVLVPRAN